MDFSQSETIALWSIGSLVVGLLAFGFVLLVVGVARMLKPVGRVLSDWEGAEE